MAKFIGSNKTKSARYLMHARGKYKLRAFPENTWIGPEQVVDFGFVERTMYGRIDNNGNPIVLKPEFLKGVSYSQDPGSGITLVDFVLDMFADLQLHKNVK